MEASVIRPAADIIVEIDAWPAGEYKIVLVILAAVLTLFAASMALI